MAQALVNVPPSSCVYRRGVVLSREDALILPFAATQARGALAVSSAPDLDLVSAARSGDRAAFAELYRTYVRMVHGVLLARVPRARMSTISCRRSS